MANMAEVLKPSTLFYIHRNSGRLYWVNGSLGAEQYQNKVIFEQIKRSDFDRITAQRIEREKKLTALQGLYRGQDFHVFGNGPSLNHFAAKQNWQDHNTIGVNAAGHCIKPLGFWISVDNMYVKDGRVTHAWIRNWLSETRSQVLSFAREDSQLELQCMRDFETGKTDWAPSFIFRYSDMPMDHITRGLYYLYSSVHAAIELARHLGARRIFVWGCDYHDRSHSYSASQGLKGDLKDNSQAPWSGKAAIFGAFETVRDKCKTWDCEVFNANPNSLMKVLPFVQPELAFKGNTGGLVTPPIREAVLK